MDAAKLKHMMLGRNDRGREREQLCFPEIVRDAMYFLEERGFQCVETLPTLVKYRSPYLFVNVYHGRQSFEVGVELGTEGEGYSLAEVIRAQDPEFGETFRNPVARTRTELARQVPKVADLVNGYATPALEGDSSYFAALAKNRRAWSTQETLKSLILVTRPKAEAAFREGRYDEAATLYGRIESALTPSERAKLSLARRRASTA